jgi:adenine/guanine phosphoribosyltransferase-like PRPP-binding protein
MSDQSSPLTHAQIDAATDLARYVNDYDAIVCAMDAHALALGSVISAYTGKPLMVVCTELHGCVTQHTVCYGDISPTMRFLYVDDFFTYGRTLATVFEYMNTACQYIPGHEDASIVLAYEADTHTVWPIRSTLPTSYVPPF